MSLTYPTVVVFGGIWRCATMYGVPPTVPHDGLSYRALPAAMCDRVSNAEKLEEADKILLPPAALALLSLSMDDDSTTEANQGEGVSRSARRRAERRRQRRAGGTPASNGLQGGPMLFRLRAVNAHTNKASPRNNEGLPPLVYAGVLEFDAPPDSVVMPTWMIRALGLGSAAGVEPGRGPHGDRHDDRGSSLSSQSRGSCDVRIERVCLPLGTYAKFRPLNASFVTNTPNPRAALEGERIERKSRTSEAEWG